MFEECEGNLPLPRGWPLWGTVCAVKPQYISGLLGPPLSGSRSFPEHRIVPFFLLFVFSLSLLPVPSSHLCQFATHFFIPCMLASHTLLRTVSLPVASQPHLATHFFIPCMLATHTLLCTVSLPVCWPATPYYALFHCLYAGQPHLAYHPKQNTPV